MINAAEELSDAIMQAYGDTGLRYMSTEQIADSVKKVAFLHEAGILMMRVDENDLSYFQLELLAPIFVNERQSPGVCLKVLTLFNLLYHTTKLVKFALIDGEATRGRSLSDIRENRALPTGLATIQLAYCTDLYDNNSVSDWCLAFDSGVGTLYKHIPYLLQSLVESEIEFTTEL